MKRSVLALAVAATLLSPIAAQANWYGRGYSGGWNNGWHGGWNNGWHGHHHGCGNCWVAPTILGLGVLGAIAAAPYAYTPPPVYYLPPPVYYPPYPYYYRGW